MILIKTYVIATHVFLSSPRIRCIYALLNSISSLLLLIYFGRLKNGLFA